MKSEITSERYELLGTVREDPSGIVLLADDVQSGQQVVIRRLRDNLTSNSARVESLQKEIERLKNLKHKNIGAIQDLDWDQKINQVLIVTEFVAGDTLQEFIQRQPQGRCEETTFTRLADQIVAAFEHAHGTDFLHGHLSGLNIVVTLEGPIKMTEFGIDAALEKTLRDESDAPMFSSGHYTAPERAAGQPLTPTADYFSIGCIFYEMLCGDPPFATQEGGVQPGDGKIEPIPGVPTGLNALIVQCLDPEKSRRPLSIGEIRAGLVSPEPETIEEAEPEETEREESEPEEVEEVEEEEEWEEWEDEFPRRGWKTRAGAVIAAVILIVVAIQWYDFLQSPSPVSREGTAETDPIPAAPGTASPEPASPRPSAETTGTQESDLTRGRAAEPESRPAQTRPASRPPGSGSYTVQVGAFRLENSAQKLQQQLQSKGYSAEISPQPHGSATYYHVWVNRFSSRQEALAFRARLREAGFDTYVTRVP